jgi:hypothetical protein
VSSCKIPVVIIQLEKKNIEIWQEILEKNRSIKLNKTPFSGTQVGSCGQTDMKANRYMFATVLCICTKKGKKDAKFML